MAECAYYVYILASAVRGTLYIGVTNSLLFRVAQHRAGKGGAFSRKYKVTRLVWFEEHGENPHWDDLFLVLEAIFAVPEGPDSLNLGSSGQARG